MKNNLTIGFAGLSHLGLTTSISISKFRNIRVVAFDEDKKLIQKLSKKNSIKAKFRVTFTKILQKILFVDSPNKLLGCDIVYISKDTQTNNKNISDLKNLNSLSIMLKNLLIKNLF